MRALGEGEEEVKQGNGKEEVVGMRALEGQEEVVGEHWEKERKVWK